MIRRILAALDDSPRASDVLARAVEIATAFRASIRVFHALAVPQDFPAGAHTSHPDRAPAHLRKLANERLAGLVARETVDAKDVLCSVIVRDSHHPADAIIAEAESCDAELVVIGSHGYAGIDRLIGTTTTKVVKQSRRDVWVVYGRPSTAYPAGSRVP